MATSLRKSCHACYKAKRRCEPQLPSCRRCLELDKTCTYDLEPVYANTRREIENSIEKVGTSSEVNHYGVVYDSVDAARNAAIEVFSNQLPQDTTPILMANEASAEQFRSILQNLLQSYHINGNSAFTHSCLVQNAHKLPKMSVSQNDVLDDFGQALFQDEVGTEGQTGNMSSTFLGLILSAHDLLIASLRQMLNGGASLKRNAELQALMIKLNETTRRLWIASPPKMSMEVSSWIAWLVAESSRRIFIAVCLTRGIYSFLKNGFCVYQPYLESLPFDPRARLWEASTEDDWDDIIRSLGDEHTHLVSYHEFITNAGSPLRFDWNGDFQKLLFAAFHGFQSIDEQHT